MTDRLALIAKAVARHQPVHRGCIVECEDCGRDVWRAAKRGGVRRLCRSCADARIADASFLFLGVGYSRFLATPPSTPTTVNTQLPPGHIVKPEDA